jgi:hypothetical protein
MNGEFSQYAGMPHHLKPHHFSQLKNNYENSRKMYYNPLSVINGEFSQQAGLPHHLSPLKNNLGKYIFAN